MHPALYYRIECNLFDFHICDFHSDAFSLFHSHTINNDLDLALIANNWRPFFSSTRTMSTMSWINFVNIGNDSNKIELNWCEWNLVECVVNWVSLRLSSWIVCTHSRRYNNLSESWVNWQPKSHWLWIIPSMHISIPFHISWEYSENSTISLVLAPLAPKSYFEYEFHRSVCRVACMEEKKKVYRVTQRIEWKLWMRRATQKGGQVERLFPRNEINSVWRFSIRRPKITFN